MLLVGSYRLREKNKTMLNEFHLRTVGVVTCLEQRERYGKWWIAEVFR